MRRANVLRFNDTFQLVDYNLSLRFGETMRFVAGSQYDGLGVRLRGMACGTEVEWLQSDDYLMATQALG